MKQTYETFKPLKVLTEFYVSKLYGYELETDDETVSFCSNAPASPSSAHRAACFLTSPPQTQFPK